jgi:hypothetical protein
MTGSVFEHGFASKREAKAKRNELEGPREKNSPWRYVVVIGTEHWRA